MNVEQLEQALQYDAMVPLELKQGAPGEPFGQKLSNAEQAIILLCKRTAAKALGHANKLLEEEVSALHNMTRIQELVLIAEQADRLGDKILLKCGGK